MKYWTGYDTEPVGGSNPYYCCVGCGMTDPHINGDVTKHTSSCTEVHKFFDEYPEMQVWLIGSDQAGEYIVGTDIFRRAKDRAEITDHIRLVVSEKRPFI